jgi:hypothetical protein
MAVESVTWAQTVKKEEDKRNNSKKKEVGFFIGIGLESKNMIRKTLRQ